MTCNYILVAQGDGRFDRISSFDAEACLSGRFEMSSASQAIFVSANGKSTDVTFKPAPKSSELIAALPEALSAFNPQALAVATAPKRDGDPTKVVEPVGEIRSSFAGLGWSIGNVPLGLDMQSTMIEANARSKLKRVTWAAKSGTAMGSPIAPVEQYGYGRLGVMNIHKVSDQTTVHPTDWHTGQMVFRVGRHVSSRKPELMPTPEDLVAAVIAKYGGSFLDDAKTYAKGGIGQQSFSIMAYPVKNGRRHNGACYDIDFAFATGLNAAERRYNKAKEVLTQIKSGNHCKAVLVV